MLICLIHYGFYAKFVPVVVFSFSLRRYEVNQGLEVRGLTITVFSGAYLSSIADMLELKRSMSNERLNII